MKKNLIVDGISKSVHNRSLRAMSFVFAGVLMTVMMTGCRSVDSIRVGTYNIRCSIGDVGTCNDWTNRRADMVSLVRDMELDVFGMQEVCPDQADYLVR